jgi:hypothetical protein
MELNDWWEVKKTGIEMRAALEVLLNSLALTCCRF